MFFGNKLYNPFINHISNIFFIMLLCSLLRKKVFLLSVGASNIKNWLGLLMTKCILSLATLISVRDNFTYRLFSRLSSQPIILSRDPAFLLTKSFPAEVSIDSKNISKKKMLLSIHKDIFIMHKNANNKELLSSLIEVIEEFACENNMAVFLYNNYTTQEYLKYISGFFSLIRPNYLIDKKNELLPEEIIGLVSEFDYVLSSQMHLSLFSYLAEVPFSSIAYSEKVDELHKIISSNYIISIDNLANKKMIKELMHKSMCCGLITIKKNIFQQAKLPFTQIKELLCI